MTRYQQIAGGYFPYRDEDQNWTVKPISGKNPKMDELGEILSELDCTRKTIIFARFRAEVDAIFNYLYENHTQWVLPYHGGITPQERDMNAERFQWEAKFRFFVATQQTAGLGLTLTAADTVIYYSNSFSYEERVQSEDRAHRKGQENKVTYIDLLLDHPIDQAIGEALANKQSMADYVRDRLSGEVA